MTDLQLTELRAAYTEHAPIAPSPHAAVAKLEVALGVKLSDEMRSISTFFSGDLLGGIEHYEIDGADTPSSIAARTIELRQSIKLPSHFVVLAEPPESIILWDSESDVVTWCDAHSVDDVMNGRTTSPTPDTWFGYAEFFRFLVQREADEK